MPRPKKMGRPKNPRIKTLENKVEALLKQIEEMEKAGAQAIDDESLTCLGIGCIIKDNKYMMQVLKYDPKLKIGKVVDEKYVGDASHRADFEMKKYMAHNFKYEEMTDE